MAIVREVVFNSTVGLKMIVEATEVSTDRSRNTSTVRINTYMYSRSYFYSISPSKTFEFKENSGWSGNGQSYSVGTIGPLNGTKTQVFSKTVNVPHNANGSVRNYDFTVTGKFNFYYGSYWFGTQSVNVSVPLTQWTNYSDNDVAKISKITVNGKESPASNTVTIPIGSPSIRFDLTNLNFGKFNYKYKIWKKESGSDARWHVKDLPNGQTYVTDNIIDMNKPNTVKWQEYTSYSTSEYWITIETFDGSGNKVGEHALTPKLVWDSPATPPTVPDVVNMQTSDKIAVKFPKLQASPVYNVRVTKVEFNTPGDVIIGVLNNNTLTAEKLDAKTDITLDVPVSETYRNLFKSKIKAFSGQRSFKVFYTYFINGPGDCYSGEIEGKYSFADSIIIINENKGVPTLKDTNVNVKNITSDESILVASKSTIKCTVPQDLFTSSDVTDSKISRLSVQIGNITADTDLDISKATASGGNPTTDVVFTNSNSLSSAPTTYTITAYNNRGKQLSKTYECNIIPYSPPRISYTARRSSDNSFVVSRPDNDATKPYISPVNVGGSNKNYATTLSINYKVNNGAWVDIKSKFGSTNVDNEGRMNLNHTVNIDGGAGIQKDSKVTLELVIVDRLGGRAQQSINVPSWKPLIHIDGNRNGVAVNDRYPANIDEGMLYSDKGFITNNSVFAGKNNSFADNYSRVNISEVAAYSNDFDNINFDNFRAGWYHWAASAKNKPSGDRNSWGTFFLTGNVYERKWSSWLYITAYDTDGKIYFRRRINQGNWQNWVQIPTGDAIGNYRPTLDWLHNTLNSSNGPRKENIRLKSLETKFISGSNLDLNKFTEEGNFWYEASKFSNKAGNPFTVGYLTNEYNAGGKELLQTFRSSDGTRMITRGKNHGANNDSDWDKWVYWYNTDNFIDKGTANPINGWSYYYPSNPVQVIKLGNKMVFIKGWVKNPTTSVSNELLTIPDWAIPPVESWGTLQQYHQPESQQYTTAVARVSGNKVTRVFSPIYQNVTWAYIDISYPIE